MDTGKIEIDLKCWTFKEALLNMAKNIMVINNDPLYDVISLDQLVGWVLPNSLEQKMCELPHTGDLYKRDNKMVRGNILKAYLNNPSR